jgi:hypothetical protein
MRNNGHTFCARSLVCYGSGGSSDNSHRDCYGVLANLARDGRGWCRRRNGELAMFGVDVLTYINSKLNNKLNNY